MGGAAQGSADGRRVCRTCGEPYPYPDRNSLATRAHCQSCAEIPRPVRRALEIMGRRLQKLERHSRP